jgi:hypothetical protein
MRVFTLSLDLGPSLVNVHHIACAWCEHADCMDTHTLCAETLGVSTASTCDGEGRTQESSSSVAVLPTPLNSLPPAGLRVGLRRRRGAPRLPEKQEAWEPLPAADDQAPRDVVLQLQ